MNNKPDPAINAGVIKEALRQVIDRDAGVDVVSAGMISGIVIRDGKVGFVITIEPKDKDSKAYLRETCENAVAKLSGIESVTAVLTAQLYNSSPLEGEQLSASPKDAVRSVGGNMPLQNSFPHQHSPHPNPPPQGGRENKKPAVWNMTPLEHVRSVIVVASGKGGVGKSTTAANLAMAWQSQGKRIGLLDADIYGPSLPRMMGLLEHSGKPPEIIDGKMIPPESHGIKCMSMGFITGDEAAILRGPMISKTLHQLLRFTRWGTSDSPLDALIVDMPPGTGDIHLSMVQQVPLTGAIIVTTPQEVAIIDAKKCIMMFRKLGTPVLGVIENMSYFADSAGARVALFGEGGGKRLAGEMDAQFLGEIPIDAAIGIASDNGRRYSGSYANAYSDIIPKLSG